jgi:hypothetical protein
MEAAEKASCDLVNKYMIQNLLMEKEQKNSF